MNFQCPNGFDVQNFLLACSTGIPPVTLEAGGLPPDGFLVYVSSILSVTLYTPNDSNRAVVTNAAVAQGATPI